MPLHARHLLPVAACLAGGLALTVPAADAKPQICGKAVVEQKLIAAGKLTETQIKQHMDVDLIRCGDVTGDGVADAVLTIASGGTAGDIRFGVLEGTDGAVLLFKPGYKVGIARHDSRSFDILEPHYGPNDPNCCPRSFREQRYTWTGSRFKGGPLKKLKSAPRRFYRP
jgi:hypothetical protein